MILEERMYSVLVASAADQLNTVFAGFLPETRYDPVRFVKSAGAAEREWSECAYDLVIINSPLPDDTGIRFAAEVAASKGSVPLLLVRADSYDDVFGRVVGRGVFVLPKPFSRGSFSSALDFMTSTRERLRASERRTLSVEDKIEEIRLVNRAKWFLIAKEKMEEPAAHRYIEKQAMDRGMTRREVAEEIIRAYG